MTNLSYIMEIEFQPISVVVNNVELLVVNKNNPARTAIDI